MEMIGGAIGSEITGPDLEVYGFIKKSVQRGSNIKIPSSVLRSMLKLLR
jgi:hypothetical protein